MSQGTYYLVDGEELMALQVTIAVAVDALGEVLAADPAPDVEVSAKHARDGAARHLSALADILAGVTPGTGAPAYRCTACGVVLTDGMIVHHLHCRGGGGRFFRVADQPAVEGGGPVMADSRPARSPALVTIRLMGPPEAVTFAAERLALVLSVAKVSHDYPNRPPSQDVRRYLDVLVDGDDLLAEEARWALEGE